MRRDGLLVALEARCAQLEVQNESLWRALERERRAADITQSDVAEVQQLARQDSKVAAAQLARVRKLLEQLHMREVMNAPQVPSRWEYREALEEIGRIVGPT